MISQLILIIISSFPSKVYEAMKMFASTCYKNKSMPKITSYESPMIRWKDNFHKSPKHFLVVSKQSDCNYHLFKRSKSPKQLWWFPNKVLMIANFQQSNISKRKGDFTKSKYQFYKTPKQLSVKRF